jgi:hypothetical protein
MESSCLDPDIVLVSHEILCILWEAQLQCCVYKSLPLVPILSQIYPVHANPSYFFNTKYDVILPSMPGSP